MIAKILLFLGLIAIVIAILLSTDILKPFLPLIFTTFAIKSTAETSSVRLFTKYEISQFTGSDNSEVYLAIVGDVFDVTKGRRHYGDGGGYHFFSGI